MAPLPGPLLACRSHRWHATRAVSICGTSLALPRVADMLTVLKAMIVTRIVAVRLDPGEIRG